MSDHPSLDQILAELHEALEASGEDLDPEVREELRQAAVEIEAALGSPGERELSDSLADSLRAGLERFEESHPRLTAIVGRIADALSDLGI
jgi:hypothetical protein